MARERGDDQDARLRLLDVLLEMKQCSKRRDSQSLLANRDLTVANYDAVYSVRRPRVSETSTRNEFTSGANVPQPLALTVGEEGAKRAYIEFREAARGHHYVRVKLVALIKHSEP